MKNILLLFIGLFIGSLLVQIPDLVGLYNDHVTDIYQEKYCKDKGLGPDQCGFDVYFYPLLKDHPTIVKWGEYFQMGEGSLYFIASGRCSNRLFHNPSAAPKDTGKITCRDYFYSHCSQFDNDISDMVWGK